MTKNSYKLFIAIANILMSSLMGVLISYPFAISKFNPQESLSFPYYYIVFGALAGLAIGYRRRNSRIFLYFCMLAIIILAVVISSSIEA